MSVLTQNLNGSQRALTRIAVDANANVATLQVASNAVTSLSTDGHLTASSDSILSTQKAVKDYVDHFAAGVPPMELPILVTGSDLSLVNSAAAAVTSISTDGTFALNDDATVPTQNAAKTYVDAAFLVKNAPVTLVGGLGTATLSQLTVDQWNLNVGVTAPQFVTPALTFGTSGGDGVLTGTTGNIDINVAAGTINNDKITNSTNSSQATTLTDGAVVTAGGLAIGKDVYIGGTLHLSGNVHVDRQLDYMIGVDGSGYDAATPAFGGYGFLTFPHLNRPRSYYNFHVPLDYIASTTMGFYITFIATGGTGTTIQFNMEAFLQHTGSTASSSLVSNSVSTTIDPLAVQVFHTILVGTIPASMVVGDTVTVRLYRATNVDSYTGSVTMMPPVMRYSSNGITP